MGLYDSKENGKNGLSTLWVAIGLFITVLIIWLIYAFAKDKESTASKFEREEETRAITKLEELEMAEKERRAKDKLEELNEANKIREGKLTSLGERFEKNYHQVDRELMSTISNSKKVLQVQIALMTHYDVRVFENYKKHEYATRSAILEMMRKITEQEINRPDFRKNLAANMKIIINNKLEEFEGVGGIEDVFFTSFSIQ